MSILNFSWLSLSYSLPFYVKCRNLAQIEVYLPRFWPLHYSCLIYSISIYYKSQKQCYNFCFKLYACLNVEEKRGFYNYTALYYFQCSLFLPGMTFFKFPSSIISSSLNYVLCISCSSELLMINPSTFF